MSLPNVPAIQQLVGSVVDQAGVLGSVPYQYFQLENAFLASAAQVLAGVIGVNQFPLASQPTLGVSDAGYVGYVTDYGHLVLWTGAAWIFLDGGGGFLQDFPVAPQGNGWQRCDGSATTYLTVGAMLTATAFTTPNLSGSAAYRKSGAYTGAIGAAVAPVLSGSTATGSTGTGTTGTGTTGTGSTGTGTTGDDGAFGALVTSGGPTGIAFHPHTHSVPSLSVPGLSIPGLSIPSLTVPALSVGTLAADTSGEPAHLVVPVYFRM